MAGEDRHHGRVDEMEQEVQCRGEMTGAQEQNNRRGGDRENQDYQEQDSGSVAAANSKPKHQSSVIDGYILSLHRQ